MNPLSFFTNRIAVTYIVAAVLSIVAALHVVLPASVNIANATAVVMLGAAAVAGVLRFGHPGTPGADAIVWWQSKTIITQIVAALFAAFALFGVSPAIDQSQVVQGGLFIATIASMAFGGSISRPISSTGGSTTARSPVIVVALALALAVMLSACGGQASSVASGGSVALTAAKTFADAQLTFKALQQVAFDGIQSGAISGDFKAKVIELVDRGQAYEGAGYAAEHVASQPNLATAAAGLADVIAQLNQLGIIKGN